MMYVATLLRSTSAHEVSHALAASLAAVRRDGVRVERVTLYDRLRNPHANDGLENVIGYPFMLYTEARRPWWRFWR